MTRPFTFGNGGAVAIGTDNHVDLANLIGTDFDAEAEIDIPFPVQDNGFLRIWAGLGLRSASIPGDQDQSANSPITTLVVSSPFMGETTSGLGIGSTETEVVAQLGAADDVDGEGVHVWDCQASGGGPALPGGGLPRARGVRRHRHRDHPGLPGAVAAVPEVPARGPLVQSLSLIAFAAAALVTVGWAVVLVKAWLAIRALRRLPRDMRRADGGHTDPGLEPKVSVVLAARNEEQLIERCVRSLLHAEGIDLQVVAVDDGSEDRTLELLERLATEDDRLLVLQNQKLPSGWVAKNYALELGQGRAEGDFLLFTDADVIFGRRALLNAVRVMDAEGLDHLTLHPRLEASTFVEAIVLPLYFLLCEFRFVDRRATEPESGIGAGIGAFNLVRAESYRLRGTHARIRGAVLDDRALGRMMRDDRGRGTVLRAVAQVRMRPYRTFRDLYVGIRKGVLAAFGNSATLALSMGLLLALGAVVPWVLFAAGGAFAYMGEVPWASMVAVASVALPIAGLLRARTMVRFPPPMVLLFPVGALIISACAIHAAIVFGMRGTVEWRGRQYTRRDLSDVGFPLDTAPEGVAGEPMGVEIAWDAYCHHWNRLCRARDGSWHGQRGPRRHLRRHRRIEDRKAAQGRGAVL